MRFSFKFWQQYTGWFLMALLSSCVDPFEPGVINTPDSLLVVNGFINSNGPTNITLLRTQNLTDDTAPMPEENARIFLEEEGGFSVQLIATGNGNYTTNANNLNPGKRYRLHLYTAANQEYASEFVNVSLTPKIDEITWKAQDDQLQIYANTHNTEDQTRYYRWQYEETWEFTSAFGSYLEYKDHKIQVRTEDIYHCWTTENSTQIILGNSLRLSQNKISDQPITAVPASSPKLGRKYSILLKQSAQTPAEYQYWETLKKNTESIGTLFDPLPTQLTGNIKCITNANEPVIGYIGAYSVEEKRIFVSFDELPNGWLPRTGYENCPAPDTVKNNPKDLEDYLSGGSNLPISEISNPGGPGLLGYAYSSRGCVDCRVRGTNVRPAFWK